MKSKKLKLPIIIIAIGMIVAIASCFLTGIRMEPVIQEHEFQYSVTYSIDGEVKTHQGSFLCSFIGHDGHDDPTLRVYDGLHKVDGNVSESAWFSVAQKNGVELALIINLDADYLMGDPDKYEYVSGNEDPILEATNAEGYSVDISEVFDAEIISWELPEPIENSFRFIGFSRLHAISMFAMLLVGVLTIIACAIFVKKEPGIQFKVLDALTVIANLFIGLMVIPFVTLVIFMFPLVIDEASIMYQIYLCIPALTAFGIAASISLRRKGLKISGLLVQFVFPLLFFGEMFVESLIFNFFS